MGELRKPRKRSLLFAPFRRSNSETCECCLHRVTTVLSLLPFLSPSFSLHGKYRQNACEEKIFTRLSPHRGQGSMSLTRSCANRYRRNAHVNEMYHGKNNGKREGKLCSLTAMISRELVFSDHAGRREITGHRGGLGLNTKRERIGLSLVPRGLARNKRESTNVGPSCFDSEVRTKIWNATAWNRCYEPIDLNHSGSRENTYFFRFYKNDK